MEGTIIANSTESTAIADTIHSKTIDFTFEHKFDEQVLHKLSIAFNIECDKINCDFSKGNQLTMRTAVVHTNRNNDVWMVSEKKAKLFLNFPFQFFQFSLFTIYILS